mmetsp:Transcript_15979/g.49919  ORF Transcript_15979/g.49919 Transcript_15979/m.49919 type:complete len:283 (-) Transcript_15979:151-999(-)
MLHLLQLGLALAVARLERAKLRQLVLQRTRGAGQRRLLRANPVVQLGSRVRKAARQRGNTLLLRALGDNRLATLVQVLAGTLPMSLDDADEAGSVRRRLVRSRPRGLSDTRRRDAHERVVLALARVDDSTHLGQAILKLAHLVKRLGDHRLDQQGRHIVEEVKELLRTLHKLKLLPLTLLGRLLLLGRLAGTLLKGSLLGNRVQRELHVLGVLGQLALQHGQREASVVVANDAVRGHRLGLRAQRGQLLLARRVASKDTLDDRRGVLVLSLGRRGHRSLLLG